MRFWGHLGASRGRLGAWLWPFGAFFERFTAKPKQEHSRTSKDVPKTPQAGANDAQSQTVEAIAHKTPQSTSPSFTYRSYFSNALGVSLPATRVAIATSTDASLFLVPERHHGKVSRSIPHNPPLEVHHHFLQRLSASALAALTTASVCHKRLPMAFHAVRVHSRTADRSPAEEKVRHITVSLGASSDRSRASRFLV